MKQAINENQKPVVVALSETKVCKSTTSEMTIVVNGNRMSLIIKEKYSDEMLEKGYIYLSLFFNQFENIHYALFSAQKLCNSHKLKISKLSKLILRNKEIGTAIIRHFKFKQQKQGEYTVSLKRLTECVIPDAVAFLIEKVELKSHDMKDNVENMINDDNTSSLVKTLKTPEQERQDAHEIRKSFLLESIDIFEDESDVYDVIRSLCKLKKDYKPESILDQEGVQKIISDLNSIESLLLDIAEANAKANTLFLASYEQVVE